VTVAHEVLERGIGIGLNHDVECYLRIQRAALDDGSKAIAGHRDRMSAYLFTKKSVRNPNQASYAGYRNSDRSQASV
jgi:hypothetical protein